MTALGLSPSAGAADGRPQHTGTNRHSNERDIEFRERNNNKVEEMHEVEAK